MKRLIAAILFLAPGLALAGENLSAEALLPSHGTTQAHAPVMAYGPSTGSGQGKDIYLVVWQTDRNEQADIVGLRLDKSGQSLDAKPFVISGAKDCQERPRVTFGKDLFMVVWQDFRNGKDYDVYAARVAPEGKVLDPEGILVSGGPHNQCMPVVCFDGTNFQLLWRDLRGGVDYEIYGGRVSPEGRLEDGSGVLVQKSFFSLTTNTGFPGVWSNGRGDVIGSVMGVGGGGWCSFYIWPMREGKQTGPAQKPSQPKPGSRPSLGTYVPTFASDGKSVLMTFSTQGSEVNAGAALLSPADGKIPFGTPVAVPSGTDMRDWAGYIRNPSPAWDGKSYVVAWDVSNGGKIPPYDQVYVRRISADGKPGEKETLVAGELASPAFFPAAASDGAGTTIIAYERHPKTADVPIKIGYRMLTAK